MKPVFWWPFLLLSAVILIVGSFIVVNNKRAICAITHCDLPRLPDGFSRITTYQDTLTRFQAIYRRSDDVLQIDIQRKIPEDDARKLIDSKIELITNLYEKRFVAYPDVISNEIVCFDSYRPIVGETNNQDSRIYYLIGLATNRFTFGACSDDLITYKALVAWYWCSGSNSLIQLEFMIPKNSPDADSIIQTTLHSLSCRNL